MPRRRIWLGAGSVSKDILDSTRTAVNDKLATPSGDAVDDGTNAAVASPITAALGVRYTLGGLMIDTVVNRDLFFTGRRSAIGYPKYFNGPGVFYLPF